jgi:cell division transport system permease protein
VYALQQAFKAIRNNWVASTATITTMTLSLTILAGFSLLTLNLNQALAELRNNLEITAFLSPDADDNSILSTIQSWPEVATASLISSVQGLESIMLDLPALRSAAALVKNPIPDSIDMQLRDPSHTTAVSQRLQSLAGINKVLDGADDVKTYLAINDAVRIGGLVLIVILLLSSLFAIINSVRAAITARRSEIDVMRLVGATRGFIRGPFLIEGLLLGFISALITLGIVLPVYRFIIDRLSQILLFVPFVRDFNNLGRVAILLFTLALLVGLVGSTISVSQNLREDRR